jgi:cyclophilin family peptidyl-prolyl cis-trans isomerase
MLKCVSSHVTSSHTYFNYLFRFGEGPYYVEFKILVEGMEMYFTVQTAPNEFMPHSVYTFMQMVDDGVWDNTVFIHHWNHIVQAAPISPDGNTKHDLIAYELTFPEYSDEYKHEQYTLGFSSQPGGPEFYINLMDNINSHGPGQQEHSTVLNDADPCFAKIVIGKNAFERLRQASADAESTEEIIFTTIEAVRRVTPTQEVFEA